LAPTMPGHMRTQRHASAARDQQDPSDAPCPGLDGRV